MTLLSVSSCSPVKMPPTMAHIPVRKCAKDLQTTQRWVQRNSQLQQKLYSITSTH